MYFKASAHQYKLSCTTTAIYFFKMIILSSLWTYYLRSMSCVTDVYIARLLIKRRCPIHVRVPSTRFQMLGLKITWTLKLLSQKLVASHIDKPVTCKQSDVSSNLTVDKSFSFWKIRLFRVPRSLPIQMKSSMKIILYKRCILFVYFPKANANRYKAYTRVNKCIWNI